MGRLTSWAALAACLGGCGPTTAASDGDDVAETGEPHDPAAAASCDAMSGELAWSSRAAALYPSDIALDPTSSSGELYVSYLAGACLSRHDGTGTEQWRIDGHGCAHLAIDRQGDLVLAGESADVGLGHAVITKRDPDGVELWSYRPSTPAPTSVAQDVAIATDGAVIVVGHDRNVDEGDWVLSLDAAGDAAWQTPLPGTAVEMSRAFVGTDAAGFVTAAHEVDDASVEAVRLDSSGAIVWRTEVRRPAALEAMAVDAEGRTLLALREDADMPRRSLVMLEADGTPRWRRTSLDTAIEYTAAIAFAPCDAVVVAGAGDPGPETLGHDRQRWVAKLTLDGEPIWSQMIPALHQGPLVDDVIAAIAVDAAGRVVAAGPMSIEPGEGEFAGFVVARWLGCFEA